MSWIAIIAFAIIGLVLIALEIVVLPGIISGIAGVVMLVVAIWNSYTTYGVVAGNIVLISSIIICILLLVFFMRSKTWKFIGLKNTIDSKVNIIDQNSFPIGAKGKTVSRLAPTGKALINGQLTEVHTISEFINENEDIEIIKIEGYKITVRKIENNQ